MSDHRSPSSKTFSLLIISVTLNLGLLGSLIYNSVIAPKYYKHEVGPYSADGREELDGYLQYLFGLSDKNLLKILSDNTLVAGDICKRDLALSCLTAFHYFDLERALGEMPQQTGNYTFSHPQGGEQISIPLYQKISLLDFSRLQEFAAREAWPLTAEGLFAELKEAKIPSKSLEETFKHTMEYQRIKMLFSRFYPDFSEQSILKAVLQVDWNTFKNWSHRLFRSKPLEKEDVKQLLFAFAKSGSSVALKELILFDPEFSLRVLPERDIRKTINDQSAPNKRWIRCHVLMHSQAKSSALRKDLELKLIQWGVFEPPKDESLMRTEQSTENHVNSSVENHLENQVKPLPKEPILYTVKPGDSLWKIARKYQSSVEELRQANKLSLGSTLRVGQKLKIPQGKK